MNYQEKSYQRCLAEQDRLKAMEIDTDLRQDADGTYYLTLTRKDASGNTYRLEMELDQ